MILDVSFMLMENIYSTGVTYNRHLKVSKYCYSTGHWQAPGRPLAGPLQAPCRPLAGPWQIVKETSSFCSRYGQPLQPPTSTGVTLFAGFSNSSRWWRPISGEYSFNEAPSISRAQCYKTFSVRNLRIFVISKSVCPWQAFPS
jgi:hypothetical protein